MAHQHQSVALLIIASFLLIACSMQVTQAVKYNVVNTVPNTAGGARFNRDVGIGYSRKTLPRATIFIWRTFQQKSSSDRKYLKLATLFVDSMPGVAFTSRNEIHLSAQYVQQYTGNVKREITGVLYHEMTHVWQWNGNGQANGGLIEGIADYVRLKAGYAPSHWVKPGQGDRWDQGYDVTARFLDYCNSLSNGFVARLNRKMRTGYSDTFFKDLLDKSVDQLWQEYKAKFNQ